VVGLGFASNGVHNSFLMIYFARQAPLNQLIGTRDVFKIFAQKENLILNSASRELESKFFYVQRSEIT